MVFVLAVGILTVLSGRIRESNLTSFLIGVGVAISGAYMLWSGLSNDYSQTELVFGGLFTLLGVAGMIHAGWLILRS